MSQHLRAACGDLPVERVIKHVTVGRFGCERPKSALQGFTFEGTAQGRRLDLYDLPPFRHQLRLLSLLLQKLGGVQLAACEEQRVNPRRFVRGIQQFFAGQHRDLLVGGMDQQVVQPHLRGGLAFFGVARPQLPVEFIGQHRIVRLTKLREHHTGRVVGRVQLIGD